MEDEMKTRVDAHYEAQATETRVAQARYPVGTVLSSADGSVTYKVTEWIGTNSVRVGTLADGAILEVADLDEQIQAGTVKIKA
jgi:hypothetical protein